MKAWAILLEYTKTQHAESAEKASNQKFML